jgi:hypothetical protein
LKFASGGLNPGWIAPTPFYSTTNDAQSRYYYGSRPYQTGGPTGQVFDPVLYNTAPGAPAVPFGSQAVNQPLTSAEIAAIVANPGSNNSQQTTQRASTVAAPVAPAPAPIVVSQPVRQPTPVAPTPQAITVPQPGLPAGYRYAGADEIADGLAQYQPSSERYIISTAPRQQSIQQPVTQTAPVSTPIAPAFLAPPPSQPVAQPTPVAQPIMQPALTPITQPVAPAQPADPRDAFQMPAGFRYAGGDDIEAGTAIYNPVLNGYLAPITNTMGPVVP